MSFAALLLIASSRVTRADLLFPSLLLILNLGASLASASARDYKRAAYWLASAVSIAMVAF